MSTRVHELAKELGLKSQDLLDRIQGWGLEIKPSIFAGLLPDQVDRIKGLMTGPAEPVTAAPVAQPSARSSTPPPETPAISPTAPVATKRPAPPVPVEAEPAPTVAPTPVSTPTPTPPVAPVAEPAPIAATSAQPTPAPVPPAPAPAVAPAQPPAARPSLSVPPRAGGGGLTAPPRSSLGAGTGPLSRHTPHRDRGPDQGPTQPPPMVRPPMPGQGTTQTARQEFRPNPTAPAPLKPSDYISPAGVRMPMNRPSAPPFRPVGPGKPPERRPAPRPFARLGE